MNNMLPPPPPRAGEPSNAESQPSSHQTRRRTPPTPTTAMTPGASSKNGGWPKTITPRSLRRMISLRSALRPLKPPSSPPRKKPTPPEHGWMSLTPWWRVRWTPKNLYSYFLYLCLHSFFVSMIASPDSAVGEPPTGSERATAAVNARRTLLINHPHDVSAHV